MKIHVDLRFIDITYELLMIEKYLDMLEANLEAVRSAELRRIERDYGGLDDEAERSVAFHLQSQLEDGVTTRFLAASGVVATWAAFESGVLKFAEHVRKREELSLRLSDVRVRGGFIEQAEKYFSDVLGMPLVGDESRLQQLKTVALVRHASAHGNGRLADLREKQREKIERLAATDPHLHVVDGYVIIELAWVRAAHSDIDHVISDLKVRIETEYPLERG